MMQFSNYHPFIHFTAQWKFQGSDCCNKCQFWDSNIPACTTARAQAAERQPDAAGAAEAGAEAEAMGDNIAEAAGQGDDDTLAAEPGDTHDAAGDQDGVPEPWQSCK